MKKMMKSLMAAIGVALTMTGSVFAANVEVATYDTLVAALAAGDSVKLTADITMDTKITCPDGVTIDLNGKTLSINVENSYYNNVTIENGTIVLGKDDVTVCDGYFLVNAGKTLVLNGVTMNSSAEGIKGYAVFHLKTGANLDLNNSTLNISNNEYSAGYIVYAGEATATVDIVGTTVTGSKVNGIVHATTKIESSTFTVTDAIEHGINRSGVTIKDSTVAISGGTGRGITAQHGSLVIEGNSSVTIFDMGEATIELRNDKDLTVADTATVKVDVAVNNTTSGIVTGNVSVDPILGAVVAIDNIKYSTLAEALTAAKAMTGDVTVEIYEKVTLNSALSGSYSSITFVGKDTDAEIYLEVQGYITATGKTVNFQDLKLSKSQGGFITNAGFMNTAFGVYDVKAVNYTNCTFSNGAYASSGTVTFTKCIFKRSWDKYGLWAYGDVNCIVDGCTFDDYRGIKMYAEGAAKTTELTVKNSNFSTVTDKPAIVLTYGESVNLEGNTYSSTGTFELDLDGAPNGVAVTSDVTPTCKNDNGACGVLVDGKIYTTVAQAAEVATSGSTVTLLHSSTETVEFAEGVTLNKNGFTADGVTVAQPVAKIGETTYATLQAALDAAQAGDTIELLADIAATEVILLDKNLTINGNGHKVTSSATRVFRITKGNTEVTLNGVNMVSTAVRVGTNDIRGISIDIVDNVALTLTNCSVDFIDASANDWAYAVNVTGGSNHTLTVNGGTYEGANVINVRGENNVVTVTDATLNSMYPNNDQYYGAGIWVEEEKGSSVTATNNTFNGANAVAFNLGTGTALTESNNTDNTTRCVAKIGEQYYTSLEEALAAAQAGDTVTVLPGDYATALNVDKAIIVVGQTDAEGNNLVNINGKLNVTANNATVRNINVNNGSNSAGYINAKDVLIEGCSVVGGNGFRSCYTSGTVTFRDSTITGAVYGIHFDGSAGGNIVIDDCEITGWTSFAGAITNVAISDTEFKNGNYNQLRFYQNAQLTNVTFNENMTVDFGKNEVEATFIDCAVADGSVLTDVIYLGDIVEMGVDVTINNEPVVVAAKVTDANGDAEYFITLKAAFDAVNDGETIILLDNVTYTKATGVINGEYVDGLVYTGDKSFTVDFAGYTITENGEINDYLVYFKNTGSKDNEITFINGTVTINAQSSNTAWAAITLGSNSAKHKTTLNLNGMNVVNGNPNTDANQVIRVRKGCIVNINDGTVVTSNGTSYGVVAETGSTVNINDGAKVVQINSGTNSGGNLVYTAVSGNGTINVYDGAGIVSDKYGIHNMTSGNTVVNIYGGSITAPVAVRAATNGGNGESAIVNIFGGTLAGALETYTDAADIDITGGVYTQDVNEWCVEGCAALPDLNGKYVVGVKPTATVNNLGAMTIPEDDYIVYGGSKSGDMPLSFVMQFLADQNKEDMKTSPFADWYGDFVITFTGIENGSFTADGCYLAGHYGDFGWVKVPVDGMTIENGARYPVMLGVGLGQKYDYICSSVEDFKCAMFLTPEIIEANPNLKVKLELAVVDNSQGSDSAASALVNNDKVFSVTEYEYGAEAFAPALPTATVTPIDAPEGTPLTFALNFKADEVTDAQLAYYGDWYADFVLTITGLPEEGVTFNANGTADGYLAGQYDAWSENWVSVPFEDVTLRNGESIKIMEYAATLMGQPGLKLTYNDVYSFVKDFNCGVYFTPEFLAANPDMKVSLSLRMYKTGDATDEGVAIGEMEQFSAPVVVAKIGPMPYATLEAAIAAAGADDTVTLLKNVGTDAAIQVAKKVTIDLNGKTIATTQNDKSGDGVFHVVAGGDLTIEDGSADKTGTINGVGGNNYNISVWADGGKVTINGGNFTNVGATDENGNNHFDLIYAKNGGVVVINGGKFECESPAWTLNIHDGSRQNSSITVNGGTFVGFDPRNNAAETAGTTFMAPGKYTLAEGGSYSVVTPTDYILNGAASDAAAVDPIDAALAGAVTVTKDGDKITATATYTFKVTAVDTVNPEKSEYELTGGTLRPGKSVKVKYIDLENGGATLTEKPASGPVIFKLVID